ncbi:MAG TPA: hypothetical protein VJJ80_02045 [Patescibacteria group bacterium]|nr:hypothetical protein [Patescibacteria group bacterium]
MTSSSSGFGSNSKQAQKKKETTQAHLPIAEIRNGCVVLKDGSLRLVLLVSTINFDLKNEDEQNALVYAYQNFLNSLTFPIQIVMQSRRIDLSGYLSELSARLPQIENPLLQLQIEDYSAFIQKLITVANIMNKKFFIVIPFFPPALKQTAGFWEKAKSAITAQEPVIDMTHFEEYRKELIQRAQAAASGLAALGLRAIQLTTQELIELYYQSYNPELAVREKLIPIEQLSAAVSQSRDQTPPSSPPTNNYGQGPAANKQ